MTLFTRRDQKADALKAVPLFAGLSKSQLTEIARRVDEVDLAAGATLTSEGKKNREMYFVAKGSAVVRRKGRKLAELGKGAVVGEMSLLDGQPASATVTLTTPATLLVMSRQAFSEVLEASPGLCRRLLVTLANRLRAADRRLVG